MILLSLLGACSTAPHWPEVPPPDRCAPGIISPGRRVVDVQQGSRRRQALAWVPSAPGPYDVVVNLHEFRSSPERQVEYSGWRAFAEEQGVILVAPDGRAATWNAGDCCGKAVEEKVDDVAYLDALLARIDAVACTTGRVLVTGIGNGAMMAERWACESDVPDAVISVGGTMQVEACEGRPIPWIHYHGTADRFVPADGSDGILDGVNPKAHRPVAHALTAWSRRNGVVGSPTPLLHEGALACEGWPSPPTVWCRIEGAADSWPGAADGPVAGAGAFGDATRSAFSWLGWTPGRP